jgi:Uma2 family endonuclease
MVTGIRDPWAGPLTHRDLDDTPDDGNRYEVIDGTLYVSPFPKTGHQRAVTQLVTLLTQHVLETGTGEVFTSGLKVVLDEYTGVGPDVVYVAKDHAEAIREDGYYGPPALVVEVLSSKPSLDTKVKRAKYARSGIRYYWIVDPEARVLREYRLEGGDYTLAAEARHDDEFRPELFSGLVIPLGRLWGGPVPR